MRCSVALRVGIDDVYFVGIAATGGFEGKDLSNDSLRIAERDRAKRGNVKCKSDKEDLSCRQ